MLRYLFDTDHLTLFDHADVRVWQHFTHHPLGSVGLSAVSVAEALRGRLAAIARHQNGTLHVQASANLLASLSLFESFTIVPFDSACESRYQQLRGTRLRIGSQDLRIGALALVNNLIVVTRNRRDFSRIPGLRIDDWSV